MFRNVLLVSLLTLGAAGCTGAQDFGPRMVGGGNDSQVVYNAPNRNVVGGGVATLSGGGDDMRIAYGPNTKTMAQTGLVAELIGGGENSQLVYHQAAPSGTMVAGKPVPPVN
jgi:hypothetical protein